MSEQEVTAGTDERASTTPVVAEVLAAPVADEMLEQVANQLRDLKRNATLTLALEVGRIIVEGLYDGDRDAWRARKTKDSSFRKLAERDDVSMSRSTLQRSVAVYVMVQELGLDVSTWRHLGLSHARAVLGLPAEKQQKLLTSAEEKGWTVKQLESYAKRSKKKLDDGRGRPPLPGFVKSIGRLGKLVEDKELLFGDLEQVEALEPEEAMALYQKVLDVKRACEDLQSKLQSRVPGFGESGVGD